MAFKKRVFFPAYMLLHSFLLCNCGSEASSSGSSDVSGSSGSNRVSGLAVKGPMAAASVTAYSLHDDGTRGAQLAAGVTGPDGSYSLAVDTSSAVVIAVKGGTYIDEATGETVAADPNLEMQTFLPEVSKNSNAMITPLTTIAAAHASAHASAGLTIAIANANKATKAAMGVSDTIDITQDAPVDLSNPNKSTAASASSAGMQYGAVLAGISQTMADANAPAVDVLSLVHAMAEDFGDGVFDGKNSAGATITAVAAVAPQQAQKGLATALSHFMGGPRNHSGSTAAEVTATASTPGASAQATGSAAVSEPGAAGDPAK